ncbi:MAG: flagellar motor protein MotB [Polymorphobacter sp.]|uniref:flagellar motor protein MotB n=1 Tax=Polymorphobacter sp. TaxID=1909290 RepID=UPI003A86ECF6
MKPELHVEPEVVYKKRKGHGHAHHGGAWKVAYADFVTAMMAFFMMLWIIGATNDEQRKGIADYFTPTVIQMRNSGGSNGVLGGRSLSQEDGNALKAELAGREPVTAVMRQPSSAQSNRQKTADDTRFRKVQDIINARLAGDPTMKGLKSQVRLVRNADGLRIDIIERADFLMFGTGTAVFTPDALALIQQVAAAIKDAPNAVTIRGHTDSLPFAKGPANNWTLSAARADTTRRILTAAGVDETRLRRIEGVADTDPYNPKNRNDPRNRRISITLLSGSGNA